MTTHNIAYFIGAGLTKSLQKRAWSVPAMPDFTTTMANYIDDDIVLTTMAELENAGLYQQRSDDAANLAARIVGKTQDRSPAAHAAFQDALKGRSPESIEDLLERSLALSVSRAAESTHQRFKYAINRLFCLVKWNLNLGPLERFLERQMKQPGSRHTFVSFNYDLILDFAVQKTTAAWNPGVGYGFNVNYCVTDDLPPAQQKAGTLDFVHAMPSVGRAAPSTVTILKPHGSLNWLVPYQMPYARTPQGIKFLDKTPIVPLDERGAVRYWCSNHNSRTLHSPANPRLKSAFVSCPQVQRGRANFRL